MEDLSIVDSRISEAASRDIKRWKMHDDKGSEFCVLEGQYL